MKALLNNKLVRGIQGNVSLFLKTKSNKRLRRPVFHPLKGNTTSTVLVVGRKAVQDALLSRCGGQKLPHTG